MKISKLCKLPERMMREHCQLKFVSSKLKQGNRNKYHTVILSSEG